jgi:hypothetical protein
LVVNRFELLRRGQKSGSLPAQVPAQETTHEDVFRRYRGFDGLAWPEVEHREFLTTEGLADVGDLQLVDAYLDDLPTRDECDVVALAPTGATDAVLRAQGWRAAGFDLGYFDSEWSHFSVVLNEVLYGACLELRRFAGLLNAHLLIPTLEQSIEIMKERERVAAAGADLEEAACIQPIAVFLR